MKLVIIANLRDGEQMVYRAADLPQANYIADQLAKGHPNLSSIVYVNGKGETITLDSAARNHSAEGRAIMLQWWRDESKEYESRDVI